MTGTQGPFTFAYVGTGDVYGLAIVIPLLAIAAVALRFQVRRSRKVGIGLDDWLLLPGLALYIGICICFLIGASHGVMGVDVSDTSQLTAPDPLHEYVLPTDPLFGKLQFSFQLMSIVSNCFVKLSIVSLYQRIFGAQHVFGIVAKITHGVVIAWTITFLVLAVLACPHDPSAQWSGNEALQVSQCTAAFKAGEGLAISDFILDLWLIVLPQPLVWSLQLNTGRKAMVSAIFILGLSCVGISAARVVLYSQLQSASDVHELLDRNQVVTVNIWYGALDAGIAIIACCLPTLRPLVKGVSMTKIISSLTGSTLGGSRSSRSWRKSKGLSTMQSSMSGESSWRRRSKMLFGIKDSEKPDVETGLMEKQTPRLQQQQLKPPHTPETGFSVQISGGGSPSIH